MKVIFSIVFHIWNSLNKSKLSPKNTKKNPKKQNFCKIYVIRPGKMAHREEVLAWTFDDLDS